MVILCYLHNTDKSINNKENQVCWWFQQRKMKIASQTSVTEDSNLLFTDL